MSFAGNLALAVGGAIAEGVACYFGIRYAARLMRRVTKPPPKRPALTGELIIQRPELPAPPRKELTK